MVREMEVSTHGWMDGREMLHRDICMIEDIDIDK